MLVMVASRNPELESPVPTSSTTSASSASVARMIKIPDGTLRILVQGAQRVRIDELGPRDALPGRRDRGAARRRRRDARADRADPQRAGDVHADRRGGALPARGAAARGRQHRRPAHAQPPHRRLAAPADRGEAGAAGGGRRRPAPAPPRRGPRARAGGHLDRLGDPDPGPVRDRQGPARVRPAPAAQGDPGGARRVRRVAEEARELREQLDDDRAARGRPQAGRPRAATAWSSCRRRPPSTASSAPTWSGSPSLPWDKSDRGQPRPRRTRARCSTRTTTTSSRSRTASSSSWPCASSSRTRAARSSASSARPASARRRWAARSPARWAASSSASASAACATRPRSAATAAPTSARCPGRSSARCATPGPTTRCS